MPGTWKMARTKVLIVDDHPMMRRGLREMLAGDAAFEVCGEAADGDEALTLLREHKPQVALVDVSLPSGSGLDLVKRMLSLNKKLRVLFVSMHDDAVFAERALRAGALGYVNKSQTSDKMLDAVRKVAAGELAVSQPISEKLMRRAVSKTQSPASGVERLSDRELEVFELIGRGLTTREIAERLALSVKTVETYREHIKTKLELESGTELSHQPTMWTSGQS